MGIWISMRPPKEGRHVRLLVAMFVALGSTGIGVNWWQAHRNSVAQEIMRASIDDSPRKTAAELAKIVPLKKPWGLTPVQLEQLSTNISKYAAMRDGRGNRVLYIVGDADSSRFAFNLFAAFSSAGWAIGSGPVPGIPHSFVAGVIVKVRSVQSHPPGLQEVVDALGRAGIDTMGQTDESIPDNHFDVYIGMRPDF
jgi:hypothetical protein